LKFDLSLNSEELFDFALGGLTISVEVSFVLSEEPKQKIPTTTYNTSSLFPDERRG
jgi:hypothetical protein